MTNSSQPIAIRSAADLASFVDQLRTDFETNQGEWENITISAFLEGMSAWL